MHVNVLHRVLVLTIGFLHVSAFVCPGGVFNSLTPDPNDCERYFHCLPGGKYFSKSCPSGLRFDPRHKICNWPALVPCQNSKVNAEYLQVEDNRDMLDPFDVKPYKSENFPDENENLLSFNINDVSKDEDRFEEYSGDTAPETFSSLKQTQERNKGMVRKSAAIKCETAFGFMSDPNHCDLFYHCYMWIPFPKVCPKGLFFDHFTLVCNWPRRVNCVQGHREVTFEQIKVKSKPKYKRKSLNYHSFPSEKKEKVIKYEIDGNDFVVDKERTRLTESNSLQDRKFSKIVQTNRIDGNPYDKLKHSKITRITQAKSLDNIETVTESDIKQTEATEIMNDQASPMGKIIGTVHLEKDAEVSKKEKVKSSNNKFDVNDVVFLNMKDVLNFENAGRNATKIDLRDSLYENHVNKRNESLGNDSVTKITVSTTKEGKVISENRKKPMKFGKITEVKDLDVKTTTSYDSGSVVRKKIEYGKKDDEGEESVLVPGILGDNHSKPLEISREQILTNRIDRINTPEERDLFPSMILKDIHRLGQGASGGSIEVLSSNESSFASVPNHERYKEHNNTPDSNSYVSINKTDKNRFNELFTNMSNQTEHGVQNQQTLQECNRTDVNCTEPNSSQNYSLSFGENTSAAHKIHPVNTREIAGRYQSPSAYEAHEVIPQVSEREDYSKELIRLLKESKQPIITTDNTSKIESDSNISDNLEGENFEKIPSNFTETLIGKIFTKYNLSNDGLTTHIPFFRNIDSINVSKKTSSPGFNRNISKLDLKQIRRSESNSLTKSLLEQRLKLDRFQYHPREENYLKYYDENKHYSYEGKIHSSTPKVSFNEIREEQEENLSIKNELPMLLLPIENHSKERKYVQLFKKRMKPRYKSESKIILGDYFYQDNKYLKKNEINTNPVKNLQTNAGSYFSNNMLNKVVSEQETDEPVPTRASMIFLNNDRQEDIELTKGKLISTNYLTPFHNRNLSKSVEGDLQDGDNFSKSIPDSALKDDTTDYKSNSNTQPTDTVKYNDNKESGGNKKTDSMHANNSGNGSQDAETNSESLLENLNYTSEMAIENKSEAEEINLDQNLAKPHTAVKKNSVTQNNSIEINGTIGDSLNLEYIFDNGDNFSSEDNHSIGTSFSQPLTKSFSEQQTTADNFNGSGHIAIENINKRNFSRIENINFTAETLKQVRDTNKSSEISETTPTAIKSRSTEIKLTNNNSETHMVNLNTNLTDNVNKSELENDETIYVNGGNIDYEASLKSKLKLLLELTNTGERLYSINDTLSSQEYNSKNTMSTVSDGYNYHSEYINVNAEDLTNSSMISRNAIKNSSLTTTDIVGRNSIPERLEKEMNNNKIASLITTNKTITGQLKSNTSQSINAYLPQILLNSSNIEQFSLVSTNGINISRNTNKNNDVNLELNSTSSANIDISSNASMNSEFLESNFEIIEHHFKEGILNEDSTLQGSNDVISGNSSTELDPLSLLKFKESIGNEDVNNQSLISEGTILLASDNIANQTTEIYLHLQSYDSKDTNHSKNVSGLSNDTSDYHSKFIPITMKYLNKNFTENITDNDVSSSSLHLLPPPVLSNGSSLNLEFNQNHTSTNVSEKVGVSFENITEFSSDSKSVPSIKLNVHNLTITNEPIEENISQNGDNFSKFEKIHGVNKIASFNKTEIHNQRYNSSSVSMDDTLINSLMLASNITRMGVNSSLNAFEDQSDSFINSEDTYRQNINHSIDYNTELSNKPNATIVNTDIDIFQQDFEFNLEDIKVAQNNSNIYNDSTLNPGNKRNNTENINVEASMKNLTSMASREEENNRMTASLDLLSVAIKNQNNSVTKLLQESSLERDSFSNLAVTTKIYGEETTNNEVTINNVTNETWSLRSYHPVDLNVHLTKDVSSNSSSSSPN